MFRIEKQGYGFRLTLGGFINQAEMERCTTEAERALATAENPFDLLIDLRTLRPLLVVSQAELKRGLLLFKHKGLRRIALILKDSVTKIQFDRTVREIGFGNLERYFDSLDQPNWEKLALAWVQEGNEPTESPKIHSATMQS